MNKKLAASKPTLASPAGPTETKGAQAPVKAQGSNPALATGQEATATGRGTVKPYGDHQVAPAITPKMLRGYMASERAGLAGIGFNDAWNSDKFGLTQAQAAVIRKAMAEEYGLVRPRNPDLAALNRRVQPSPVKGQDTTGTERGAVESCGEPSREIRGESPVMATGTSNQEQQPLRAVTKNWDWKDCDDPELQTLIHDSFLLAKLAPLAERMANTLVQVSPASKVLADYDALVLEQSATTTALESWAAERKECQEQRINAMVEARRNRQ